MLTIAANMFVLAVIVVTISENRGIFWVILGMLGRIEVRIAGNRVVF